MPSRRMSSRACTSLRARSAGAIGDGRLSGLRSPASWTAAQAAELLGSRAAAVTAAPVPSIVRRLSICLASSLALSLHRLIESASSPPMFDPATYSLKRGLPGTRETVAMLAGLMALNAFAIDAMLPALPAIGADLGVADDNHRQLVVVAYFFGFGSTQLIWGPLADRFGRKPVLALGILLYTMFALLCGIAGSFSLLIASRIAMGASAAVTRVLVVAVVRDLFDGEAMARIMSLVFMVFMVVPVLAPSIGQGILLFAPWRAIFLVLAQIGRASCRERV